MLQHKMACDKFIGYVSFLLKVRDHAMFDLWATLVAWFDLGAGKAGVERLFFTI